MKKNTFYIVLIFWLVVDALTKYMAFFYLKNPISLIGDFLSLKLLFNPGIAFGIALDQSFLKVLTFCLILWIFYYYFTEERKKNSLVIDIAFWCILAGAIWNWFERIFRNEVIDFISVQWFSVFNIADSLITIWAVIFLFAVYKEIKK